jgi:hypothetical protein
MLDFCRFLYLFLDWKEIHSLASKFPICFVAFKGMFLFYRGRVYTNWVPRVLKLWVFQWFITAECKCSSSEPLVTFYDQQPQDCLLQLPTRIANIDLQFFPWIVVLLRLGMSSDCSTGIKGEWPPGDRLFVLRSGLPHLGKDTTTSVCPLFWSAILWMPP